MILDSSSKNLQIVVGENYSYTESPIAVCYSQITPTTFVPTNANFYTNSTTPVTLISGPGSGQIQIQYFNLLNLDTIAHSFYVQYVDGASTRNVCVVTLQPGEVLEYNDKIGFKVKNAAGATKVGSVSAIGDGFLPGPYQIPTSNSQEFLMGSTTSYLTYLGKANKVSSSITLNYLIYSAAISVTWAELGIVRTPFKLVGTSITNVVIPAFLLGYANMAAVWTSNGAYNTTITLSTPTAVGDDLWAIFGNQASTPARILSLSVDSLDPGFGYSKTSTRPSTMLPGSLFSYSNSTIANIKGFIH